VPTNGVDVAKTTEREDIEQMLIRVVKAPEPETISDLSRRLDALVDAVEIIAREQYSFPALPESSLRSALIKARRP
jgi:hypothetical protein